MARYIYSARVTPTAFQGILKDASDREEANRRMFAAAGATLEHYYFSIDTMESILVWTTDDRARVDALLASVAASGMLDNATWNIRRVMTGPELAELARNTSASLYRAPGA